MCLCPFSFLSILKESLGSRGLPKISFLNDTRVSHPKTAAFLLDLKTFSVFCRARRITFCSGESFAIIYSPQLGGQITNGMPNLAKSSFLLGEPDARIS